MVDRFLGSMLRFGRDVEESGVVGGVQGTSWVASTEIAAMSSSLWMRFDAAARVGLGTGTGAGPGTLCIFGRRRERSEIRLGMGAWVWDFGIKRVAAQGKARQGREKSDRSWQKKDGGEKGRV